MCKIDGCEKPVHSKGLCQAHYRKMQRHGDPLAVVPLGRPRKEGATDHRRLSEEEKEARRLARKADKTHCVHGHALTPENTYTTARGQKVCRICQRAAQQKYHGREVDMESPVGPSNANKTHCKAGHEYNERNTMYKSDGARGCKECHHRAQRKRAFGVEWEAIDAMVRAQSGRCAVCTDPFVGGTFAVDHCHTTGEVRGLLCNNCNNGLGRFLDSPALLRAAAEYLETR